MTQGREQMVTNDQFWFMASALLPFANTLFESEVTSRNPGIGKEDRAKKERLGWFFVLSGTPERFLCGCSFMG